MMSARHYSKYFTSTHPLTELTFKTYIHNTFYISIDLFQNKSHFDGHLCGHLEFLETLNDASPASFRIFNSNMSSNRINNKKTIYSNAGSNLEWTGLVLIPLNKIISIWSDIRLQYNLHYNDGSVVVLVMLMSAGVSSLWLNKIQSLKDYSAKNWKYQYISLKYTKRSLWI